MREVMVSRALFGALASAGALAFASATAFADVSVEQCIASNTEAQSLRRAGKFAEAREKLSACLDPSCPQMVATDCTRRLADLDRVQPTVVFDVKDSSGKDFVAVAVSIDGHRLPRELDGTAVAVDPGLHAFTFEVAGRPPVTQSWVAKENEKSRRLAVVIDAAPVASIAEPAAAKPTTERATSAPVDEPATASSALRPVGLLTAGVGVGGLAVGAIFGLLASAAKNDYEQHCGAALGSHVPATSCDEMGVSGQKDASNKALLSTVAFTAGGVLAALGAVLFFTAPAGAPASVGVGPGGVLLQGVF
jgi:hypothetical protein